MDGTKIGQGRDNQSNEFPEGIPRLWKVQLEHSFVLDVEIRLVALR